MQRYYQNDIFVALRCSETQLVNCASIVFSFHHILNEKILYIKYFLKITVMNNFMTVIFDYQICVNLYLFQFPYKCKRNECFYYEYNT